MLMSEWEQTEAGQQCLREIEESKRNPRPAYVRPPEPLRDMINEARDMVAALGHESIKTRIENIQSLTDPSFPKDRANDLRRVIEDEISGKTNDLEACLVKQAQSLDSLYDFFIQLSQYSLTEGLRDIHIPLNLALKAQSQSSNTIEKFKKLQEKRLKNAERTSIKSKQTNIPISSSPGLSGGSMDCPNKSGNDEFVSNQDKYAPVD